MQSFYLICAKCGSSWLEFEDKNNNIKDLNGNVLEVVFVCCRDCGTITSLEEHNERIKK